MNFERYKWPVIVAASLHGALLLYTSDHPPVSRAPAPHTVDAGATPPTLEPLVMREPEVVSAGGASGAVQPLPGQLDMPLPSALLEPFTISIVEQAKPIREVVKLPEPGKIGDGIGGGPGKFGSPEISAVTSLDRVPRAMAQPAPDYPYSMRQAGINGSVTIEFVVGTDGRVISAEAVQCTHREFSEPAVRAVLRWKFEQGTIDGRKVRFRMAIPIQFNATGS